MADLAHIEDGRYAEKVRRAKELQRGLVHDAAMAVIKSVNTERVRREGRLPTVSVPWHERKGAAVTYNNH